VPLTARVARDNNRDPDALLHLPERDGALVQRVLPDSPAEAAGLRRGDLVVAVADQAVITPAALLQQVEQDFITSFTIGESPSSNVSQIEFPFP
jgi:S1-C subfamily serine protease